MSHIITCHPPPIYGNHHSIPYIDLTHFGMSKMAVAKTGSISINGGSSGWNASGSGCYTGESTQVCGFGSINSSNGSTNWNVGTTGCTSNGPIQICGGLSTSSGGSWNGSINVTGSW